MTNTNNILVCTDAYKGSHFKQMPAGATASRAYISPRKPHYTGNEFVVFGIAYFIKKYLEKPITNADIEYARSVWSTFNVGGGEYPFPYDGFKKIITEYNGFLPVKITGYPEGSVITEYNRPVIVVEVVEDPDLVWLPGFIETAIQRSFWYMSTVATYSRNTKKMIKSFYDLSVDDAAFWTLESRLHDFGGRGASSGESAATGGLAHLINFAGTDTMEAVMLAMECYNVKPSDLASSIPAAEHSTVTSWGKGIEAEKAALNNMIDQFGNNPLFAFVSDSYDYKRLIDEVWCSDDIIEKVRKAGVMPVVRPDSGDPVEMVLYALEKLSEAWGYTLNGKGYKVLNGIAVIQGDGMDFNSVKDLYTAVCDRRFAAQNVAVGMGGGLLQKHNRDDMSVSMKMFGIKINGEWQNIQKKPVTQSDKIAWNPDAGLDTTNFITYYDCGVVNNDIYNFMEIRKRAVVA